MGTWVNDAEKGNLFYRSGSLRYRWIQLQKDRTRFLQQNANPQSLDSMRPEVIDSWMRCQSYGLSPYTRRIDKRLRPEKISEILELNRLLIESSRSMFESLRLRDLVVSSQYAVYLLDRNGVLLFCDCDEDWEKAVPDGVLTGTVWDEETVGTTAHWLSLRLKRPINLLGPEHYCEIFQKSNVCAAPIFDQEGEPIAVIALSQHLADSPMEGHPDFSFLDMTSHAYGLALAMAVAVENRLKLKKSYDQLKTAHSTVQTTLSVIDEGILTIDQQGWIMHANAEAARNLRLEPGNITKRNIKDFLSPQSRLISCISSGKNADLEEMFIVGEDEQPYIINVRPVVNPESLQAEAAVLRFNSADKINAMVANRSGARASFHFEDIIGESDQMKRAIATARRFATAMENMLIIGESGTGKELFAQAVHNAHRPQGPFMAINCAAMPRELIESELFGYEGGSFTGAERSGRPGKIELAHGGTLFLDEIGDMPLELQAVLLRVLEDKQVMRVGGRRYRKVDFRVIAATNKDLQEMVNQGLFREDLYYRLSVLAINLPPLRQRGDDVALLAGYFIEKYCKKVGLKVPRISQAAMQKIKDYNWPGNVRQLENAVIYAVNSTMNNTIEVQDLPSILQDNSIVRPDAKVWGEVYTIEEMEKFVIQNALYKSRNNITKAAAMLGIGKSTLYRKLKEYDIIIDEGQ